jgi:hypothetical protein
VPCRPEFVRKLLAAFPPSLADWTPEQIAAGKRWVETWQKAGIELERIRRQELRQLDTYQTIELLCRPADYTVLPRAPLPTSGMIDMQRLFMRARQNALVVVDQVVGVVPDVVISSFTDRQQL